MRSEREHPLAWAEGRGAIILGGACNPRWSGMGSFFQDATVVFKEHAVPNLVIFCATNEGSNSSSWNEKLFGEPNPGLVGESNADPFGEWWGDRFAEPKVRSMVLAPVPLVNGGFSAAIDSCQIDPLADLDILFVCWNGTSIPSRSYTLNVAESLALSPSRAVARATRPDPFSDWDEYKTADWDGFGALAISDETIAAAREFYTMLPVLTDVEIAPGPDGTIGFEWIFESGLLRKLFVDVGPGRVWNAYWRR